MFVNVLIKMKGKKVVQKPAGKPLKVLLALFPGLPIVQFLIAWSKQNWTVGRPGNEAICDQFQLKATLLKATEFCLKFSLNMDNRNPSNYITLLHSFYL